MYATINRITKTEIKIMLTIVEDKPGEDWGFGVEVFGSKVEVFGSKVEVFGSKVEVFVSKVQIHLY